MKVDQVVNIGCQDSCVCVCVSVCVQLAALHLKLVGCKFTENVFVTLECARFIPTSINRTDLLLVNRMFTLAHLIYVRLSFSVQ